jgi:hypothetical protein
MITKLTGKQKKKEALLSTCFKEKLNLRNSNLSQGKFNKNPPEYFAKHLGFQCEFSAIYLDV